LSDAYPNAEFSDSALNGKDSAFVPNAAFLFPVSSLDRAFTPNAELSNPLNNAYIVFDPNPEFLDPRLTLNDLSPNALFSVPV
jgi:hypothetical protein